MIIDIHTHIAFHKLYPQRYMEGMLLSESTLGTAGINKLMKAFMNDSNCSKMLKQMDAAGIDKAVLLIIDGGIGLGEAELSIHEIYEAHYSVLKAHPDRFIVFAGIDPRRGEVGLDLFKQGINTYGFRGLKLYPPMGYAMDHELLQPYYSICEEKKLPVLLHTGSSLPFMENHWADVSNITKVADKYSNVNFILAHAGSRMDESIIQLLNQHPNVYLDISGFQAIYTSDVQRAHKQLEPIFEHDLYSRILFGSDWPLFNMMHSIKTNIEWLKSIYIDYSNDYLLEEEPWHMIMSGNARRILGV